MKTKIITGIVLASIATTGALVYADAQTNTGVTSAAKGVLRNFKGELTFSGSGSDFRGGRGISKEFKGNKGPKFQLTDAEKTKLETMTDAEKKAFFDTKIAAEKVKMEAEKAKRDAKESVIDKLINGESLTDTEKVTLSEIKTERTAQKAEKAKMEAKMEEIKPILEKIRNGQVLTSEEQKKLYAFKKEGIGRGPKGEKGPRGGFNMGE